MYLVDRFAKSQMEEGSFFRATAAMFKIPLSDIEKADVCELWGTEFKEVGPDYCEYRFFKYDKLFATHRVEGY